MSIARLGLRYIGPEGKLAASPRARATVRSAGADFVYAKFAWPWSDHDLDVTLGRARQLPISEETRKFALYSRADRPWHVYCSRGRRAVGCGAERVLIPFDALRAFFLGRLACLLLPCLALLEKLRLISLGSLGGKPPR